MKISKFFLVAICIISSIFVISCDKDNDTINTDLVRGAWAVERDIYDDATLIYNFTTNSSNTYSWGTLVTSFMRHPDGVIFHDREYDYHIFGPEGDDDAPIITLTLVAELDASESETFEPTAVYRIDLLTKIEMHWTLLEGDGESTLSFHRFTPKS